MAKKKTVKKKKEIKKYYPEDDYGFMRSKKV